MIRPTVILLAGLLVAAPGAGDGPPTRPAEDAQAARSLRRCALDLAVSPDPPGGAARRWLLLAMALRLSPSDAQTSELAANAAAAAGDTQREIDALDAYLAARPQDHARRLRRLSLELAGANTAEQRIAVFEAALADDGAPAACRAEAAAGLARVLYGRSGPRGEARDTVEKALALDAFCATAAQLRLEIRRAAGLADAGDEVRALIALLGGDPRNAGLAATTGLRLHELGRPTEAALLLRHAWRLSVAEGTPVPAAAAALADALIDAGKPEDAVKLIEPLRKDGPADLGLLIRLVEAYRAMGKDAAAQGVITELRPRYAAKRVQAAGSAQAALEAAWYSLAVDPDPEVAVETAGQAYTRSGDLPPEARVHARALLGAAELKAGRTDKGLALLTEISDKHPLAATTLAEHHYAGGDDDAGRTTLLTGLKLSRSGWAYRRLEALAKAQGVEIPPMAGADDAAEAFKMLDPRLLELARAPEKALAVELEAVPAKAAPGEPLYLRATLRNAADTPVPLGARGLAAPVVVLKAEAGDDETFDDLPVIRWPAPRYLEPGGSLTAEIRVDVGALGQRLRHTPFAELPLKFTAVFSPVIGKEDQPASSVPAVSIEPARVVREALLARASADKQGDPVAAYAEVLGWIVYDIQRGALPARLRAARQVASLLSLARRIERKQAKPPAGLENRISKPVLLRMLVEILKDDSPAVRAELLASLSRSKADPDALPFVGPVVDDPAPLVRLRMAEMIGTSKAQGGQTLLKHFAEDLDPLVRRMASAFAR